MKLFSFTCIGIVTVVIAASGIRNAQSAQPRVFISFTGIAEDAGLGYTVGDSATFTFGLNKSFTETGESLFTNSFQNWLVTSAGTPSVFSSISGTGLSGTYVRGSGPITVSSLSNGNSGFLGADAQNGDGLGIFAGGTELGRIDLEVGIDPDVIDFAFSGSYLSPSTYFADYTGIYATDPDSIFAVFTLTSVDTFSTVNFTPTSVTITSVPEPGETAVLVLCVLGVTLTTRAIRKLTASR